MNQTIVRAFARTCCEIVKTKNDDLSQANARDIKDHKLIYLKPSAIFKTDPEFKDVKNKLG